MTRKNINRVGLVGVGFALMAVLGFAAGAFAGGLGGPFGHGGAMHWMLAQIVDDLGLSDAQQQHLDRVHAIVEARLEEARADHIEKHQWLREQILQGQVDEAQVRAAIDGHVERMRSTAYQVADELVALANSLDEGQRTTLIAKVDELHQSLDGGCGGKAGHLGAHHESH